MEAEKPENFSVLAEEPEAKNEGNDEVAANEKDVSPETATEEKTEIESNEDTISDVTNEANDANEIPKANFDEAMTKDAFGEGQTQKLSAYELNKVLKTLSPRRVAKEAEDILNNLKPSCKPGRRRNYTVTSPYFIDLTDDGFNPLLMEIDHSVVDFDPSKQTSVNQSPEEEEEKESVLITKEEEQEEEEKGTTEEEEKKEDDRTKLIVPKISTGDKFLPSDATNFAGQFTIDSYAKSHFRHHTRGIWGRESVSMEELTSFSTKKINAPLLVGLDKDNAKLAIRIFKLILQYTGIIKGKMEEEAAIEIVKMIANKQQLIDETYFQLMKQTNGNPEIEILKKTWNLFLTIATIFPSSPGCEIWIKSHIARNMSHEEQDIKVLAKFTYIRFNSRCSINEPLEKYDDEFIKKIPSHPYTATTVFGVSIYEIMWNQRRQKPNCPIPYFLVQMVETLKEQGALSREGIFRIPGSMRMVKELAELSNQGKDVLRNASVDDIASLMKKWFRELSDMIVPAKLSEFLTEAVKNGKCIEFAHALPPVNSLTLAYFIGFLQELSQHKEETKMGIPNLAMVFSPNIVQPGFGSVDTPPAGTGQAFIEFLIYHWDVSQIYPLKIE